jgi:glycosyltransferase involved in cell wall biosynthesis
MPFKNRILIVLTQTLDPQAGGVQRNSWVIGQFLRDSGFNVVIFTFSEAGNRLPEGIQVIQAPAPGGIRNEANLRELRLAVEGFRPSIVINQMGFDPILSETIWQLRKQIGFNVVACYQNNPSWYRENLADTLYEISKSNLLKRLIFRNIIFRALAWLHHVYQNRRLFQLSVSRSDRYMLLSPTFFDELKWYVPKLSQDQVVIIPNQFEVPELRLAQKKNIILYVGRIEQRQKQILLLPKIWGALCSKLPDWELHIVGDGPDLPQLKNEFSKSDQSRVFIHGKQDPEPFYKEAKIFTLLSRYEGFGNTLIEAQSNGVVPVAFDSYSAIRWIVNDRKDAILVEPFALDTYVSEVLRLAQDHKLLEAMATEAHCNSKRFSIEVVGRKWLDVIDNLTLKP